jgi:electron transfer flavoprotein beta subunit
VIAVCVKWVDLRPEVDPLSGVVRHDARTTGLSDADQAALEWALRAGEAWGQPVVAVTAGPVAADAGLRDALAAGATSAVRVELDPQASSATVAAALAPHVAGAGLVLCGDLSADRGTGSVPAFLAGRLAGAQALGLVALELGAPGSVTAVRRLDGGRRERLVVPAPAVCSVEGSTARLRRAPLAAVLAARHATVAVHAGPASAGVGAGAVTDGPSLVRPYRPRARVRPAPQGATLDRVRQLAAGAAHRAHGAPEVLEPATAAARVLDVLTAWRTGPAAKGDG